MLFCVFCMQWPRIHFNSNTKWHNNFLLVKHWNYLFNLPNERIYFIVNFKRKKNINQEKKWSRHGDRDKNIAQFSRRTRSQRQTMELLKLHSSNPGRLLRFHLYSCGLYQHYRFRNVKVVAVNILHVTEFCNTYYLLRRKIKLILFMRANFASYSWKFDHYNMIDILMFFRCCLEFIELRCVLLENHT